MNDGEGVLIPGAGHARSSHWMTSRHARRAAITTIHQAHLAETYLTNILNTLIISNNTFHDKVPFNSYY
jgi:hypothetical protein